MVTNLFFIGQEEKNFFFEKRKVFFADINNSEDLSQREEREERENKTKKTEEREEKEAEEKLLLKKNEYTQLLKKALQNDEHAISKIDILQKKNEGNILQTIVERDFSLTERNQLQNILKEVEKEREKKFRSLMFYIRDKKKLRKDHLSFLAKYSISSFLEHIKYNKIDKKNFFQAFNTISVDSWTEETQSLYDGLEKEINDIFELENSKLTNSEKKNFLNIFASLRKLKNKKSLKENKSEIFQEYNLKRSSFFNRILEKITERTSILSTLSQTTDILNEDEDSASQEKKEEKMYEKIKKELGEAVAKKARNKMDEHEKEDMVSRWKSFYEVVNTESIQRMNIVEQLGIKNVLDFIKKSERVSLFMIDFFPGIPTEKKQKKQRNLKIGYSLFYSYISALKQSEKEKIHMPILKFWAMNNRYETLPKEYVQFIPHHEIFSKKEARLCFEIEENRLVLEKKILKEYFKYEKYLQKVNRLIRKKSFFSAKEEEKKRQLQSLGILTEKGIQSIINDEYIEPFHFTSLEKTQQAFHFSQSDFSEYVKNPIKKTIPQSVIKFLSGKDTIPENIITFFSHDRISKGLASITQNLEITQNSIISYADENGWFELGSQEKAKTLYSKLNDKEMAESSLEEIKIVINDIENKIIPFSNSSGTFQKLFQNTLQFLEKKKNEIILPLDQQKWNNEILDFSQNLAGLMKLNTDENDIISSINGGLHLGVGTFQRIIDTLNTLNSSISSAINSENPEDELSQVLRGSFIEKFQETDITVESWETKKILFSILKNGTGTTKEAFETLKIFIKNEKKGIKGEVFIIKNEEDKFSYDINNDQILIPENFYEELKNGDFDENNQIQQINLMKIFHENFHVLTNSDEKNIILDSFDKKLEEMGRLDDYRKRSISILGEKYKNSKSIMEEPYAMFMGARQLPEKVFNEYFNRELITERKIKNPNEKEPYGMNPDMQLLVLDLYETLPKGFVKKIIEEFENNQTYSSGEKNRKEKQTIDYAEDQDYIDDFLQKSDEDENNFLSEKEKNEKKGKEPITHKDREIYIQKLKNKKESFYGKEGFMRQLNDSRNLFSYSENKELDKWVKFFEESFDDAESNIHHWAKTFADADNILQYIDDNVEGKAQEFVSKISSENISSPNFLKNVWNNTTFLSLNDIGNIFSTTWEYVKRRYENKAERRVGSVGTNMFDGISKGLSNEFKQKQESKENEEVGKIKDGLPDDNAQLLEYINSVNDRDTMKALMGKLSEKGFIEWTQKSGRPAKRIYAEKLKELGATVRFYETDFEPENIALLNSKFQKAFFQIYGEEDLFWDYFNANKKAIKDGISNSAEVASQRGGHEEQLQDWLRKSSNGDFVSFQDYEGYIQYMVSDGIIEPSSYIYYLIMGVKEGILTPDAFQRFYEIANNFPPADMIRLWSKEEILQAAKQILPEGKNSWDGVPNSFINWAHINIMTHENAIARTIMNTGQSGFSMDHDNANFLTSIGNASVAVKFLATGSTGKTNFKETTYNQSILGMMQNITSMGLYANTDAINHDTLKETIRRQAGYFASFDSVGMGRVKGGKSMFRFSDSFLLNSKDPRGKYGYNDDMNTGDYLEMGRTIFSHGVDENFKNITKNFIFNSKYNDHPKELSEDWDNIYSQIPEINDLFEGNPPHLDVNKGNSEDDFAKIIDKIFTYYLTQSPNADANVSSIAKAAKDIAEGVGVKEEPKSSQWNMKALSGEKNLLEKYSINFKNISL